MSSPRVTTGLQLDTNYLIFGMDRAHPAHRRLRAWLTAGQPLAISAMAWSEFRCGPLTPEVLAAWESLIADRIVPLDRTIAERASDLFNLTGRRTRSLPDCLIAATAMRSGARLATLNRADFAPMVKLGLVLA
jgi:predicted nucleic acid-binding protein